MSIQGHSIAFRMDQKAGDKFKRKVAALPSQTLFRLYPILLTSQIAEKLKTQQKVSARQISEELSRLVFVRPLSSLRYQS